MKTIITLLSIFLSVSLAVAEESVKTFERSFHKTGIEEFVISSNYGKVEIAQVESDTLKVYAQMKVIAKSGVKADETLELIEVLDSQTGKALNIETRYGKDMSMKQLFTNTTVSVDYKIQLPKGIKLRVIAANGNTYLGNFEGELNLDIRSGDFKAGALKGETYVKQEKGDFKVEEVALLTGDFRNCSLLIESGDNVRLTTNTCDGDLKSIDKLNIRSSSGEMKIGDIEELTGSSSFTKYVVQALGNILDMDMKMGEMNIRGIESMFSEIRLKASFTKVGLTFGKDAGYNLEIKHNKSLKMDLPPQMKLEERGTAEKNTMISTKFVGDVKYTGKVFLDLSNGSLYIL